MASGSVVILAVILAIAGPLIAPYDPTAVDYSGAFAPPSAEHWLGTDDLGRDSLSRLIVGTRAALQVSLLAVGLALLAGLVCGLTATVYRGAVSTVVMRSLDVLQSLPAIVLAVAVVLIVGPSITGSSLSIALIFTPPVTRLVHSEAAAMYRQVFIEASKLSGFSPAKIAYRHLLPNIAPALVVQTSAYLGAALLIGAALDFLGLGTQPPGVSWGGIMARSYTFLPRSPELVVASGLAVAALGLSFSFIGDSLSVEPRASGERGRRRASLRSAKTDLRSATEDAPLAGSAQPAPAVDGLALVGIEVASVSSADGTLARLVHGVSLTIPKGAIVGLVGESGSGKTLTSLSALGMLPPGVVMTRGSVYLDGERIPLHNSKRMRAIRGERIAMVSQDPMTALAPFRSIEKQLADSIRAQGSGSGVATSARIDELLAMVGVPNPGLRRKQYPFELSGGLRQRVVIARALARSPEILIADEATTSLDAVTRAGVLSLLVSLREELGLGVLFVTHDLALVDAVCDEVVVMYAGEVVESGPRRSVIEQPKHPYTEALVGAAPRLAASIGDLEGPTRVSPGASSHPHSGCSYWERCKISLPECRSPVSLRLSVEGRLVRCVHEDGREAHSMAPGGR